MNYWNEDGLLRAQTYENDQNMILRLAYYHLFSGDKTEEHFQNACKALGRMHDDGRWAQHPYCTWEEDRASHDELTAILYFLTIARKKFWDGGVIKQRSMLRSQAADLAALYLSYNIIRKQIRISYYLKYIQIIFYLLAIKHKSKIFLYPAVWIIYFGVKDKERANNGHWDTDSELLALLKIDTIEREFGKMPMKEKIMGKIKEHWGDNYQKELIDSMLHYAPEHPLRQLFV